MQQDTALLTLSPPSQAAGARLFVQSWTPAAPKAVILLAHGYAEHSGRYDAFAQQAMEAGYAVYALDHWGHGQSTGERGFVRHFSVFLDGIEALLVHVQSQHPKLPRVLLGHSMGGLIAASHLITHQDAYAAAVLSGPAVKPGTPPSFATRVIGQVLSRLVPKAGLIQLDASAVSRDPAVVARYLADPLVHSGKMSARLAAEMLGAMEALQANAPQLRLPLLVAFGAEDRLAAPAGGAELVAAISSKDKEFRLLPGLYHEIFNEPEGADVIKGVLDWMKARLPKNKDSEAE
jgi:alpha-beta hydrolase superfamily lysophospholipase